jgi:hypothetical protein
VGGSAIKGRRNEFSGDSCVVWYRIGIALWKERGLGSWLVGWNGIVKSYRRASITITTAFSKAFGCQHPSWSARVGSCTNVLLEGRISHCDWLSSTVLVRRNPLAKK